MQFEHRIQINPPGMSPAETLSRAQLWAGLMSRVRDARPFMPGLDACEILHWSDTRVERRLRWGALAVEDRVVIEADRWLRFETSPGADHNGGLLTITIETPTPGDLFLRFGYEIRFATGREIEDAAYSEFLRQAYAAADTDTVRVIRELTHSE
ncbi:MAG: DUF1857 family protein [Proteobacteria bacterium]|nr:DUF1857 family protein [Pseudomonadota bacterium]HQR03306.1 SRPBCC family protein [Rhodocyclaceae bacterium]